MIMQTTLDRLLPGEEGTVTEIGVSETLKKRLADFGMISGTRVSCAYRSPGANLTAVSLRGSVIALRTSDMKEITVVK